MASYIYSLGKSGERIKAEKTYYLNDIYGSLKNYLKTYQKMKNVLNVVNIMCTISAFFKGEGTQTNIGLGQGKALEIFNSNIISFKKVGN